jgi:hypothetical protein
MPVARAEVADASRARLLAGVDATVSVAAAGIAEPLTAEAARARVSHWCWVRRTVLVATIGMAKGREVAT